jgi:hypothetical protein
MNMTVKLIQYYLEIEKEITSKQIKNILIN